MPYILLDPTLAAPAPASTAGQPRTSVGETLASLQADLQEELGNRGDADLAKLQKWINKAYLYLCSVLTIKETFAEVTLVLSPGQAMYLLPDNVAWIKGISIIDAVNYPMDGGISMVATDIETYRKLPDDTVDLPSTYFRDQRLVVIYPTPRAYYNATMSFKVVPAPLVNATDSPILPVAFHEALLLRAKHVGHRATKNHVEAGIARNDFASDVRSLENTDAMEQGTMAMGMRPIRKASQYNNLR